MRRDLIDDDEAPKADEVLTYPEVKAFLRKQEKNGAFPAKPPEKALGPPKFARAVATMRALERMADFGLRKTEAPVARAADLLLDSQDKDGGIGDLALGETPESRARAVALHFHGWALAVLCRSRATTTIRASSAGFATCSATGRPTAAGPGAACAPIRRPGRRATS